MRPRETERLRLTNLLFLLALAVGAAGCGSTDDGASPGGGVVAPLARIVEDPQSRAVRLVSIAPPQLRGIRTVPVVLDPKEVEDMLNSVPPPRPAQPPTASRYVARWAFPMVVRTNFWELGDPPTLLRTNTNSTTNYDLVWGPEHFPRVAAHVTDRYAAHQASFDVAALTVGPHEYALHWSNGKGFQHTTTFHIDVMDDSRPGWINTLVSMELDGVPVGTSPDSPPGPTRFIFFNNTFELHSYVLLEPAFRAAGVTQEQLAAQVAGTVQVTYAEDGQTGETEKIDLRMLAIQNLRTEPGELEPNAPLPANLTVKADLVALPAPGDSQLFPEGWKPTQATAYQVSVKDSNNALLRKILGNATISDPDASGRVGAINETWNGRDENGNLLNSGQFRLAAAAVAPVHYYVYPANTATNVSPQGSTVRIQGLAADPPTLDSGETINITAEVRVSDMLDPSGQYTLTIRSRAADGTPPFVKTFTGDLTFRGDLAAVDAVWDGQDNNHQAFPDGECDIDLSVTVTEAGGGEPKTASATADVTVGDTTESLTIHEAETDRLIATSDPVPFDFESDPIAALESALMQIAATLNLSKSNDDVVLDKLPQTLQIRYITNKSNSVNNTTKIDVKVRTSHSSTQSTTVNLPYLTETPTKITFRGNVRLVQGSASTGEIAINVTPNSFTTYDFPTFDFNPGAGGTYEDGSAQDGLFWELTERNAGRVKLGRAAELTPEEKTSKAYRASIPPTRPALLAAGFEDLIVEGPEGRLKAWTRIKNQAERLYISSHGLPGGTIFAQGGSVAPGDAREHWASGKLKQVIIAGCSVLNIGNFNGWSVGYSPGVSPGVDWKGACPSGCLLLGYNATAPLGNAREPAGSQHADTRILIRFQEQLPQQQGFSGQEAIAMAWLVANASMEQRIADDACAITDNFYYFIYTEAVDPSGRLLDDPHKQNDSGNRSRLRQIWRVSKTYWTHADRSGFKGIPSPSGRKLLRALPAADNTPDNI